MATLLQQDYKSFVKYALKKLYSGNKVFKWSWHMDCIIDHLQALGEGGDDFYHTVFSVPPRHTKSTLVSHLWQPWMWLRNPSWDFISASYNKPRARADQTKSIQLLDAEWYREIVKALPEAQQYELQEKSKDRITTNRMGTRISMGRGNISGENADFILIDDILGSREAHSDAALIELEQWWREVIMYRVNDPLLSRFVVIGQRLNERDIIGLIRLTENMAKWNWVVMPTEFESKHPTPFQSKVWKREGKKDPVTNKFLEKWEDPRSKEGELLFPVHYNREAVDDMKERTTPRAWSSQHQARPAAADGDYFLREWFKNSMISQDDARNMVKLDCIQSWDTAMTPKKLQDKAKGLPACESVCTTWYLVHPEGKPNDKFALLVDMYGGFPNMPELREKAVELFHKWQPSVVLIEDVNNGRSLIQEMEWLQINCFPFNPKEHGDKFVRAQTATPMVKNGKVLIPDWKPGFQLLIDSLVQFPNGGRDVTDSTSQALLYMRKDGILVALDPEEEDTFFKEMNDPYVKSEEEVNVYV